MLIRDGTQDVSLGAICQIYPAERGHETRYAAFVNPSRNVQGENQPIITPFGREE